MKPDSKITSALDAFRARLETKQSKAGVGKRTKRRLASSNLAFRFSVWLAAKRRQLDRMAARDRDRKLGKLAQSHGIDFEVVKAIHEFTGENWKETRRKCDVVIDSGFERYRPEDAGAFPEEWPDSDWLASLTCRVPFEPSTVERVFELCDRDRDQTRELVEHFAKTGVFPSDSQILRLKS